MLFSGLVLGWFDFPCSAILVSSVIDLLVPLPVDGYRVGVLADTHRDEKHRTMHVRADSPTTDAVILRFGVSASGRGTPREPGAQRRLTHSTSQLVKL